MSAHCIQQKKNQILKIFSKKMVLSLLTINGISPQILKEIFQFRDAIPYHLRKRTDFQIASVHNVVNGTCSIKFLGPKI